MQLTENVHALKISFQIPISADKTIERFVYVHLIYGERVWLIDTGVARSESVIYDYLRKTGKSPEDIAGIILTHSHPDHIGSAGSIQKKTGCAIFAHGAERNWIEDVDVQARERPAPGFSSLVGGSVAVSRILNEGDILELDRDLGVEVLHTPGHSRGSISLLLRNQGILFTGDAVPVRGEMPVYEDAAASAASLRKLRALNGVTHLLSSWDAPREGKAAYESLDNGKTYMAHIHKAVVKVKGREPGCDAMELCGLVLAELGLPQGMSNSLVARSFQSHMIPEFSRDGFMIRRTVDEDCDGIVSIFNHYVKHSFAAYPEQPVGRSLFEFLKSIIYEDAFFVVQNAEKNVAGFGFLKKYHPYPAFDRTAEIGYFIMPSYTRSGLGSMLLERLEKEATMMGIESLLANISSLNPQSLEFHKKHGFRQCGRFEKILAKFGQDMDIIWMQKML